MTDGKVAMDTEMAAAIEQVKQIARRIEPSVSFSDVDVDDPLDLVGIVVFVPDGVDDMRFRDQFYPTVGKALDAGVITRLSVGVSTYGTIDHRTWAPLAKRRAIDPTRMIRRVYDFWGLERSV